MEEQQAPSITTPAATEIPGVGALLGMSWQIYISRIGVLFGIMAISVIVSLLVVFFCSLFYESQSLVIGLFCFVLYLIAFIVNFWSQVSLYYAIKEREQRIGIQESFQRSWPKIFSFLWVSLLAGFIGMGGFLFLIIPGVIFTVWFSLALYVLVAEDLKGMNALFRSKQLVSGNWGGVFWRLFAGGLIVFAIAFFVSLLSSLLGIPFIEDLISFFMTPFIIAYSFLLYEALKKIKEGVLFEPPAQGTKVKYILVGILGILLIIGILASIVLVSLQGAGRNAKDARAIADMSQIRFMAEVESDNDYSGVSCLNSKIAPLCDDIEQSIEKEPIIHSSQEAYCAYIELSDGYFCMESDYSSGKTWDYPGAKGYCDGITFVCP